MTKIVISQVYGGGGNASAPYRNDFIELFNAGNTPVSLSGWSVQYASATSTSWSVTNLTSVSLLPGNYYLVQEASGGAVGANLPTSDVTGTISLAATAGKVALVNSTTALAGSGCPLGVTVLDFVGYGTTADCFKGAGRAPAPGNTTADLRSASGCTDTGNNSSDFSAAAPHPRNSSAATNQCAGTIVPPELSIDLPIRWRDLFAFQRFSLYSSVRAVVLTEKTRSDLFNLSTERATHLHHRRHKALSVFGRKLGFDQKPIRSFSG